MILLWGLSGDGPLGALRRAVQKRGAPFVLLDQRRILDIQVELRFGETIGGLVSVGGKAAFDLARFSSVYNRTYDARRLPDIAAKGPDSPALDHVSAVECAMSTWIEVTPALAVNRGAAMSSNSSKPYQSRLIRPYFAVPPTLVTTDPEEALAFWQLHGTIIYKSTSGVRSIVSRLADDQRARIADVTWCPTQFQAHIAGRDHRVHVVGDEVFASEVLSDADDYRYATRQQATTELRACDDFPPDVADRCRALARALGMPLVGIDLRRTPDGEWYCFEVNPSPAFTYYEARTGQPIADALAALLACAHQ